MEWLIDIIKEWVLSLAYATKAWVEAKGYATQTWVLGKGYAIQAYVELLLGELMDWIVAQEYLRTSLVDRGDPAAPDWTHADFIRDSTWRDLNLSGIVPAGAKAVLFEVLIKNTLVNKDFQLRRKGNVNIFNVSLARTQVANIRTGHDKTCPCDSDRFVQYYYTAGGTSELRVTVKGWWF